MVNFLIGIALSLLPERYRSWWEPTSTVDFRRATMLSGLLQIVGCLFLLIHRYLAFFVQRVQELGGTVMDSGKDIVLADKTFQFGMGTIVTLEYLIQPLTLLLIYFGLEGLVRLGAAFITEELLPTLPLAVAVWVQERVGRRQAERALGPRVADLVERGDGKQYDLRILSCRPKPTWDRLMTVAFEDEHYEVVKEEAGRPPLQGEPSGRARRFVYWLRKIPRGKIIRGLHHYDPNESLQ